MKLGLVFPGQGSQSVGMLADLAATYPQVQATFGEASEVLGYDLWSLVRDGPETTLNETERTQPAMLAAGVAVWRVWNSSGGASPAVAAGHSLGEYTALVCTGALEFAHAVELVAERGRLMQAAVPAGEGAMAAVLGLPDERVREVCEAAAQGEVVAPANFNAPGQVVIAGHAGAVERALTLAREAGAKRAVKLAVSVPSHCNLMRPAAERLAERLDATVLAAPSAAVLHNVDAAPHEDAAELRAALREQLYNPVRWVDTIQRMAQEGVDTVIECGPGKVLAGLVKRIDRRITALPLPDAKTLEAALETTGETP
ncbi:MAG: ACP S-malonyltransferase [Gammaproteobacteria bacterium]|nr:ACP S-malonyltransferase [Gammaproteobacteria bacterium]NIR85710.1 ACP S-malonyltransferase [Gammaproteobacteria bacterium]NIR90243.1 ACP S-malonyltransferase [Gammaproteobacteria bacterium]NIU06844.1 ACP S-malonyltransferase [Gammaproteobacteria bacterium]NIV53777.1 ACP S-malonyltransferase [Gammaproteobacteria bacterium]